MAIISGFRFNSQAPIVFNSIDSIVNIIILLFLLLLCSYYDFFIFLCDSFFMNLSASLMK